MRASAPAGGRVGTVPASAFNPGWISSAAGIATAGTARNTHRQPRCSTIRPASAGPTSDGTTQAAANAAKIRRRNCSGYA